MDKENQRSSVTLTSTFDQITASPSIAALSKLSDEVLRRKGVDDLVRIVRGVEGDYTSLLSEHGNVVKEANRRLQIQVLESRSLKEDSHRLQNPYKTSKMPQQTSHRKRRHSGDSTALDSNVDESSNDDDDRCLESGYYWDRCEKKERHTKYRNPDKLKLTSLPKHFRSELFHRAIISMAELCVRIENGHVSMNRPAKDDYFPKNMNRYNLRGKDFKNVGSGWINHVQENVQGNFQCVIITAKHVVYDSKEMEKVKVQLRWKHKNVDLFPAPTPFGVGGDEKSDRTLMYCNIDDMKLAEELSEAWRERNDLMRKVNKEMKDENVVVVCGFPHNCQQKYISFGEVIGDPIKGENDEISYKHSSLTCYGVSGGITWIVGKSQGKTKIPQTAPHMKGGWDTWALSGAINVKKLQRQ